MTKKTLLSLSVLSLKMILLSGCLFGQISNRTKITYKVEVYKQGSEARVLLKPSGGVYKCKPGDTVVITGYAEGPEKHELGFNPHITIENNSKETEAEELSTVLADGICNCYVKLLEGDRVTVTVSPSKQRWENFVELIKGDATFRIIAEE